MQAKRIALLSLELAFAAFTPALKPSEITGAATDFACDPASIQARAGQAAHLRPQNNGSVEQDLSRSVFPIAEGSVAATPEARHDMGHL